MKCGVPKCSWHKVFALGLGLLKVGFSAGNAMIEDAFKVEGVPVFVFAASAIKESIGRLSFISSAHRVVVVGQTEDGGDGRRRNGGRVL